MTSKKRILILLAHPSHEKSEINIRLYNQAKQCEDVTLVDLYAEYPMHNIDVDAEQQRLREHDIIIFLFPLYWYSTPAILKDWQDLVLEYGFAYGTNGDALQGKTLLCAFSAGGPQDAYKAEGYNHFTIRELLRPLEQTATLCGMNFIAPFALFCARTAVLEERLDDHIKCWLALLQQLSDDTIDLEEAKQLELINHKIDLSGSAT